MPILFILFIVVPVIEMYLLIQVGGVIGAGWTIFLVVLTAAIGAVLVRSQGLGLIQKVQTQMAQGKMPAMEMAEGLFILVAGALLMTPGFFTDTLGFACLIPPLRRMMIKYLARKGVVRTANVHVNAGGAGHSTGPSSPKTGDVLEGEFRKLDE